MQPVGQRSFFEEHMLKSRLVLVYRHDPMDVVQQGGAEPVTFGDHMADPFMQLAGRLLDVPFEQRDGHRFLAWKVLVERTDRNARSLRNTIRCPGCIPVGLENLSGRDEDLLHGDLGAALNRLLSRLKASPGPWFGIACNASRHNLKDCSQINCCQSACKYAANYLSEMAQGEKEMNDICYKKKGSFKSTLYLQGMNGLAKAEARQRLDTMVTNDGIELPITNIIHTAFAFEPSQAELATLAEKALPRIGCARLPRCSGRARVIATIMEQDAIRAILEARGFPGDSPAQAPPEQPPMVAPRPRYAFNGLLKREPFRNGPKYPIPGRLEAY